MQNDYSKKQSQKLKFKIVMQKSKVDLKALEFKEFYEIARIIGLGY
jgi:hypothetical protein